MERFTREDGTTVSYRKSGAGPPLVLVHGGFSDHVTNWEFVTAAFEERFTVYALARRGRGATDATSGHTLMDEAADVAALIRTIGEPVFLLGHSYGGQCALHAALIVPERVRKLVVYEAPSPAALAPALARLDALAAAGAWDEFALTFFRDSLHVPVVELEALRATELWPPIVADAPATLGDLHALAAHRFVPESCRALTAPVLLQFGSNSPRDVFVTDALLAALPNASLGELAGEAHEGMTTAPGMYAEAVTRFLLA